MDQPTRRLTVAERDRAWHAIEGAEDPDPGTILAAVLRALHINAPSAEDEQAAILRTRTAGAPQAPTKSYEELKAECHAAMADADIASHPGRV
ncbi:hypothetical protein [Streptomyces tanashiensis]|uniref:hypothetical protein n=1 Tax=Streptomyces tanashiensis TaxID=67367 RepID=UPI0033DFC648